MTTLFVPLLLFLLLAVVYGQLMRRVALKGLTVERKFEKPAVFQGEKGEMLEVVVNDRPLPVPWLRVESRISTGLQLGRRENLSVSGSMYHQSLFMLLPYQRVTRHHQVTFLKRGVYDLGNAALTAGDLIGIFTCTREQQMSVPLLVYPRLPAEDELPAPLARLTGDWARRQQLMTDPFLYRGIREYRPGDPVRDIHWPATARTGETMVRVHDPSARLNVMVLVNSQLTQNQWENLSEAEQGTIEYEISLAAGLCVLALRHGLNAGFGGNMPVTTDHGVTFRAPAFGPARQEELLADFARLRVLRTLSFTDFLKRIRVAPGAGGVRQEADGEALLLPPDTDLVVLTCYECNADRTELDRLSALGCRVTLVKVPVQEGGVAS